MSLEFEIWVDAREQPRKCTVTPLVGRPDVRVRRFDPGAPIPMEAAYLLHHEGTPLDAFARSQEGCACLRLGVLDTTWGRMVEVARRISAETAPRRLSIPPGYRTAYPRRNKKGLDPTAGLATVEAIFLAAAYLGRFDETFLAQYYWRRQFLDLNRELLDPLRRMP